MSKTSTPRTSLSEWIDSVQEPNTKRYINERVIDQMNFYKSKSRSYKKKYHQFMTASIIVSLLIPLASIFADGSTVMKFFIALLGSCSTAITAYLRLQNYHELWTSYRYNREYLLSVLYAYFTKTGIFRKTERQDEADCLLIETCEACFMAESGSWKVLLDENHSNS